MLKVGSWIPDPVLAKWICTCILMRFHIGNGFTLRYLFIWNLEFIQTNTGPWEILTRYDQINKWILLLMDINVEMMQNDFTDINFYI